MISDRALEIVTLVTEEDPLPVYISSTILSQVREHEHGRLRRAPFSRPWRIGVHRRCDLSLPSHAQDASSISSGSRMRIDT